MNPTHEKQRAYVQLAANVQRSVKPILDNVVKEIAVLLNDPSFIEQLAQDHPEAFKKVVQNASQSAVTGIELEKLTDKDLLVKPERIGPQKDLIVALTSKAIVGKSFVVLVRRQQQKNKGSLPTPETFEFLMYSENTVGDVTKNKVLGQLPYVQEELQRMAPKLPLDDITGSGFFYIAILKINN